MKESDLNAVRQEVQDQLLQSNWSILEYVDLDDAIMLVSNIYFTSDRLKGFGQDVEGVISVISSRFRISVIIDEASSFWKDDEPICQYNNLDEDIGEILLCLQAAIERAEYNAVLHK